MGGRHRLTVIAACSRVCAMPCPASCPSHRTADTSLDLAVEPFRIGTRERMVYVDVYDKVRDHCMEMKVTIKTKVEHPEQEGAVHQHDSPEVNFGCDDTWFVKGSDSSTVPFYLDPAPLASSSTGARRPRAWASIPTTMALTASST